MSFDEDRAQPKFWSHRTIFFMGPHSFFCQNFSLFWLTLVKSWITTHISCHMMRIGHCRSFLVIGPFLHWAQLIFLSNFSLFGSNLVMYYDEDRLWPKVWSHMTIFSCGPTNFSVQFFFTFLVIFGQIVIGPFFHGF